MKRLILLIVLGGMNLGVYSQTKIGFYTSDAFDVSGNSVAHYGISRISGIGYTNVGLSGYFGLNFYTEGKERIKVVRNGNVGIGTATPQQKFEVNGNISVGINSGDINTGDNTYGNKLLFLGAYPNTDDLWMARYNVSSSPNISEIRVNIGDDLNHYGDKFSIGILKGDWYPRFVVQGNGNVGIGTNSPDSKLTVKGNIHAQEVKVDLAGSVAPDYVFKKDYDLKTLEEVEAHIHKEGHLPNIPSAKEMEEDGINLKEMNLKLLEKIEELTLYVIGQQKFMKLQENKFNNQIQELKIELNNLKER